MRVLTGRNGSPAAACSSPADSATGGSWTNRASHVSRRIHRLLRVPPSGSSASVFMRKSVSCKFSLGWPPPAGANPALRAWSVCDKKPRTGVRGHRVVGLFPDLHGELDGIQTRSPPASAGGFYSCSRRARSSCPVATSFELVEYALGYGQVENLPPHGRGTRTS